MGDGWTDGQKKKKIFKCWDPLVIGIFAVCLKKGCKYEVCVVLLKQVEDMWDHNEISG